MIMTVLLFWRSNANEWTVNKKKDLKLVSPPMRQHLHETISTFLLGISGID